MGPVSNVTATERSKTRIVHALTTLLSTVPYEKISISRLCNEAGISRQTFYKNFKSIDAIVHYKLQQIQSYCERQVAFPVGKHPHFADFYSYIQSNPEYELLLQRRFSPLLEKQVKDIYKNYLTVYEDARTIPILAMTADAFEETIHAAKQAGMNAYITKPIVPDLLYKIIVEQLQKK